LSYVCDVHEANSESSVNRESMSSRSFYGRNNCTRFSDFHFTVVVLLLNLPLNSPVVCLLGGECGGCITLLRETPN